MLDAGQLIHNHVDERKNRSVYRMGAIMSQLIEKGPFLSKSHIAAKVHVVWNLRPNQLR